MTDSALLRDYSTGSQDAFGELVRRHAPWVYSVARRRLGGDMHLAEDVTQAVFVVLARKAHSLRENLVLSAWLFEVMRMTVLKMTRDETRRRRRETTAAALRGDAARVEPVDEVAIWREIESVLDESVARLGEHDRTALLLRFYERKSFAEVASVIGASEEAARKRVARAIDRLRSMLSARGATAPASATLGVLLWDCASAAPAPASLQTLAQTIAVEQARLSVLQLAKGAILMMAWQKARIAIISAAILLFSGTVSVSLIRHSLAQAQSAAKPAPTTAPTEPQSIKLTQVTPILNVQDMSASLAFYTERLGFNILWEWGDPTDFAAIGRDGLTIFLSQEDQKHAGVSIYLTVSDVNALHRELVERGLTVEPPGNRPWGMREMLIEDPDGYQLRIGAVYDKAQLPAPKKP